VRNRLILLVVASAAIGLAVAAIGALRAGVPIDDPWLFPLLVVVPATAAIALALSLRARPATRANIVVLMAALIAGLYVVESALALLPSPSAPPSGPVAAAGDAADRRTRFEVVTDMRGMGEGAYPSFGARGLRSLNMRSGVGITLDGQRIAPLAQLVDRTIVDCNESGQFSIFRTDERGFNNPPGLWNGPIDVAAVGDSFVQGSCVGPGETLVAGMRRRVPATVGAGIADSGPFVYLGIIKEYLADVKPRDVVWFHYEGNDLRNLASEYRNAELRIYLEPGGTQRLLERQQEIDQAIAGFVEERLADPPGDEEPDVADASFGAGLRQWIRLNRIRSTLGLANVNERLQSCCDLATFEATLLEARRTVESWGGRFHFAYLPAGGRYFQPLSAILDDDLRYRGRVHRLVNDLGIPVLDVDATFRASGDPTRFFHSWRSHYNPEGYRVVADAVIDHLESVKRADAAAVRD